MSNELPNGLSKTYWSIWYPGRKASVSENLEPGESWIGGWDGVGLYEGNNKVPDYQTTSFHLTTHRIILIPESQSAAASSSKLVPSLQAHLSNVRQTEYYTGFMRSSPKITLTFGRPAHEPMTPDLDSESPETQERNWTCGVCGFVNPLQSMEVRPSAGSKCGLCGVAWSISRNSLPPSRSQTPKPSPKPDSPSIPSGPVVQPRSSGTDTTAPLASSDKRVACPACTFLNHPTLPFCEICSTPLPKKQPPPNASGIPGPSSESAKNGEAMGKTEIVRLSFRTGGEKEGYRRLKNVLSDKAWERKAGQGQKGQDRGLSTPENGTNEALPTQRAAGGIDGILQSINLDAKQQDEHMQDAFKDLEVLMVRAGEMVKLAQSLNAKLSASQAPIAEEDATLIRNSLVQLGLQAPALTQDMVRDEERYHEGLAKELGSLLTSVKGSSGLGLMVGNKQGRGVIGLDEIWGLWMRARGVSLLPPSTLMSILSYLPSHTSPPIRLLTLPSSLKVLHTPSYAPPAILARIQDRLSPDAYTGPDGLTEERSLSLLEIASHENLPIGLTKELMESIEALAPLPGSKTIFGLVRDDQAVGDGGTRWYRDIISPWNL